MEAVAAACCNTLFKVESWFRMARTTRLCAMDYVEMNSLEQRRVPVREEDVLLEGRKALITNTVVPIALRSL